MGLSIRAQQIVNQRVRERAEARVAEAARRAAEQQAFHENNLDRHRAAAALGLSVHKFKRRQLLGLGPVPMKTGSTKQARTYWHRDEIAKYLADPAAYEAAKKAASRGACCEG